MGWTIGDSLLYHRFFLTNKHGNDGQLTIHTDVYTAKKESYPPNALHPIYEEHYNSVSFIVLFQIKSLVIMRCTIGDSSLIFHAYDDFHHALNGRGVVF